MKSLKKPAIKYFEFYKVDDASLIGKTPEGNIVHPCDGKKRKASISTMINVCSETYGPGNYVALELGRSPSSLPLSYWVLKIRPDKRGVKRRVILSDDQLQSIKQVASLKELDTKESEPGYFSIQPSEIYFESADSVETFISGITGVDIFALERQKEAGLAATYLKQIKDPDPSKRKPVRRRPGRPKTDDVKRACVLRQEGKRPKQRKEIIKNELIKKGIDHLSAEDRADKAIDADKKAQSRKKKYKKVRQSTKKS